MKLLNVDDTIVGDKFQLLSKVCLHVNTVDFTNDFKQAVKWLDEGEYVFQPNYIYDDKSLAKNRYYLVEDLPLYTLYTHKSDEYRVYVFNREVFKVDAILPVNTNTLYPPVRSVHNGYCYYKEVSLPKLPTTKVLEESLKTIKCLGLTFGVVSIIYNKLTNKVYVLGVKTKPKSSGSAVTIKPINFGGMVFEDVVNELMGEPMEEDEADEEE